MERAELRISGFGGQGVILAAYVLGKAAAVFENRHATLNQSFGPEARGSACSHALGGFIAVLLKLCHWFFDLCFCCPAL